MGIGPGYRSCYRYGSDDNRAPAAPNPLRYDIKAVYPANNAVVVMLNYPDCTNYEGDKICVFEGIRPIDIFDKMQIDPHFSKEGFSPIARFEPTDRGWRLAIQLADSL